MPEHTCQELRELVKRNEEAVKSTKSKIAERERNIEEKKGFLEEKSRKIDACLKYREKLENEIKKHSAEKIQAEFQKEATDDLDAKWRIQAQIDGINDAISRKRDAQWKSRDEQSRHEEEVTKINDRIGELEGNNRDSNKDLQQYQYNITNYRSAHSRQCPDDYLP
jgi:chromosome segregation ATPase